MHNLKSIAFLINSMSVGGVETATLRFFKQIPSDRFDIDLYLVSKEGLLLEQLPSNVNVIELCGAKFVKSLFDKSPLDAIKMLITEMKFSATLVYIITYILSKLSGDRTFLYRCMIRICGVECLPKKYDLAISYAGPWALLDEIVLSRFQAIKKYAWIHYDINKFGFDSVYTEKNYLKFDSIYTVSEEGYLNFTNRYPFLQARTSVFYNLLDNEDTITKAGGVSPFSDNNNRYKVLTVGRLSSEKGQLKAIQALSYLKDYPIEWHFVGEGKLRSEMIHLSKELGVDHMVVFQGLQINPFPYMKYCDIYVQPSDHEGYCITLAEALCFNNPIIATDFAGAKEQLKNRDNTIVCGHSPKEIADSFRSLIDEIVIDKSTLANCDSNTSEALEYFLKSI